MEERIVEGELRLIQFVPPGGATPMFTVFFSDESKHEIMNLDDELSFNCIAVTFADLLSKIATARQPIHVKLYWRDSAYVHCKRAEFLVVDPRV